MYAKEQYELERQLLEGIGKCHDLVAKERDKYKLALATIVGEAATLDEAVAVAVAALDDPLLNGKKI